MVSAKTNYLYNSIYTVLNMLLPLITAPYLARIIGAEGVGIYAYNYSVAYYFVIIAKLGLINYGTRKISRVRNDKHQLCKEFSSIYYMQVMSTLILTFLYLIYLYFVVKENVSVAGLFAIFVIGTAIDIDWVLFGLEQFKKVTLRNIVIRSLTVVFIFLYVKSINDVWLYALIMSMGFLIGYVAIWFGINKDIEFVKVKWSDIMVHFKPCLILLVPVLAMNLYRTMDKVLIGSLSTMTETGLFDNAEKIIQCLCGFIASLGTVMMPRISNMISNFETQKTLKYLELSMHYIAFLTVAMTFGLISIADSLIPLLYGKEFIKSIDILILLSLTLIFIGWGNVIRTQYVIPYNRDNIYVSSILSGAFVNLVLNVVLIPRYGSLGAVFGTIFAEFTVPFLMTKKLKKELPFGRYFINFLPYLIFGIIMCSILIFIQYILKPGFMTMMIQVILGAIIYISLCAIFIKIKVPELWRLVIKKL